MSQVIAFRSGIDVSAYQKPENVTVWFFWDSDVLNSLWINSIANITKIHWILDLKRSLPSILILGVREPVWESIWEKVVAFGRVQEVLKYCSQRWVDILQVKAGNLPQMVWMDHVYIWGERDIGPNEFQKIIEVAQRLREIGASGRFSVDQILNSKSHPYIF